MRAAAYRFLAPLRLGRLLPTGMARRLRRRILGMPAADVLAALDALSTGGVDVVVAGGWGIDALLERQTRRHSDLDLLVSRADGALDCAQRVLARLGYQVVENHAEGGWWAPVFVVLRNGSGRTIELLPWDGDTDTDIDTGTLAGNNVLCLSAEQQLAYHRGYPPTKEDRRDIDRLRRHLSRAAETPRSS